MKRSSPSSLLLLLLVTLFSLSSFAQQQIPCPLIGYYENSGTDYNADPNCEVWGTFHNVTPEVFTNNGGALLDIFGTLTNTLGDVYNYGALWTELGGTLNNSGGLYSYGSLFNQGTLWSTDGLYNFGDLENRGTLTNGGDFNNSGSLSNVGTITNTNNHEFQNHGYFLQGGYLANYASVTNEVTGTIDLIVTPFDGIPTIDNFHDFDNGGILNLTGLVVLNNYSHLDNVGTITIINGATFNSQHFIQNIIGTIQTGNGGTLNNSGDLVNFDKLTNGVGGQLNNSGLLYNSGTLLSQGTISNSGTIENWGDVQIDHGAVVSNQPGGKYQQWGGNTVVDGQLNSLNTAIQIFGGTLAGTGTISSPDVHVDGTLSPGDLTPGSSIGLLSVFGDYTQGASGTFLAELAGVNSYDQLFVGNVATFDGTLDVMLLNGFVPSVGDIFLLIEYLHSIGSFATLDLPTLPSGEAWTWQYVDSHGFVLSVYQTPEPATLLMLGSALGLMGYRFRSKRNCD